MKQSKLTGKYIYDQLRKLYTELEEIGEACDMVSDDMGQQSAAYRILNESYKKKAQEIDALENQMYTIG